MAAAPVRPGTAARERATFPVLFDLVGFTGSGASHLNWKPVRGKRRRAGGAAGSRAQNGAGHHRVSGTALPGSAATSTSIPSRDRPLCRLTLTRELVPFVDREFRTLASREHRGCFGKSSGGYGAIIHGMRHADCWGAVADHSGDCYFDFCYGADWPTRSMCWPGYRARPRRPGPIDVRRLERGAGSGLDDGRVRRFLEAFDKRRKPSEAEVHCVMNLCMAASYDPDPARTERVSAAVQPRNGASASRRAGAAGWSTIRSTWCSRVAPI